MLHGTAVASHICTAAGNTAGHTIASSPAAIIYCLSSIVCQPTAAAAAATAALPALLQSFTLVLP
jgi:hypothetical protein